MSVCYFAQTRRMHTSRFSKTCILQELNLRRRAKQRVLEFRARCKCCIASVSAGARLCAIVYLLVFPHHHPPPTTHHPPPRTIMHQPPYNKPTPPPRPPPTPHVHSGSNQGSRRPPTPSAVRRQGEGGACWQAGQQVPNAIANAHANTNTATTTTTTTTPSPQPPPRQ